MSDVSYVWRIMPGEGASEWDLWRTCGAIGIGWATLPDLRSKGDWIRLDAYLRSRGGRGSTDTNRTIKPFVEDMRIDDIVIAGGTTRIYGIGMITSHYLPKADPSNPLRDSAYPHARRVDWGFTNLINLYPDHLKPGTLQRISSQKWMMVQQRLSDSYGEKVLALTTKKPGDSSSLQHGGVQSYIADADAEALEGEKRYAFLAHYQRDSRLRKTFIATKKPLVCEICEFDFEKAFGELGVGYAHAHHEDAIAARGRNIATRLDRMRVLCPNCHAMIHRGGECRTIEEVRAAWTGISR